MKKQKYKVFRATDEKKLTGFFDSLFRRAPRDHYIVKISFEDWTEEDFYNLVDRYKSKIEWYRRERSIVFVPDEYDPVEVPPWLSVAPSELEASDVIDFEEIERDLNF